MENPKLLNFYRQFFLLLLTALGISYVTFLLIFSQKIYSGFAMQLIFLASGQSFSLGQTAVGIFWLLLLFRLLESFFKLSNRFFTTQKLIRSLNIIASTPDYFVFKSSKPSAITAGLLRPRIYLSSALIRLSTPDELSSVVYHEKSHQNHFDPLKNLFLDYISDLLPPFPLKSWLFAQYQTLVEISCDAFSLSRLSCPTSLISALVKIQEFKPSPLGFINSFSAQSERIKILVGQKTQNIHHILAVNFIAIVLFILTSSYLSRSNIFYQCQHLFRCFHSLVVYQNNRCHLL